MSNKFISKALFASFLTFSSMFAIGQTDESIEDELLSIYGSEELISIATGYKQPVSKAPAVASVILADDIKKMGALDIDDVLETIPGLHVARNELGYNPIYTFRGIYADFNPQVLMLVNGIPLTNLFGGDRNLVWGGMPVESIDRIEVIRGPGSAVYGADAFAGVINIITKSGNAYQGLDFGGKVGSFSSKSAFVSYGHLLEEGSFFASLEMFDTDGSDSVIDQDAQSFYDLVTGTNVSLAPGKVNLGKKGLDLRLGLEIGGFLVRAGVQRRRGVENGVGIGFTLDPNNEFKSDRVNIDATYVVEDVLIPELSFTFLASYLSTTQEVEEDAYLFPAGTTGPFIDPITLTPIFGVFPDGIIGNPEVYESHSRFSITSHYEGLDNHDLSLAVGYYYGDLYKVREYKNYYLDSNGMFILPGSPVVDVSDSPFVFLKEGDRKNYYAYIQDTFKLSNDWDLTFGVRYDHYSDFGDTVNPRLALVWSTSQNLTTKFLYGEAFRAPAFSETRAINNPTVQGNPDLDPETLKSYELVFDYKATYDVDLVFNTFYYQWEDIIQFVPDVVGGSTRTAQNAGEQKGYGFEVEADWRITNDFNLLGNFAWQRSTDQLSDDEAGNAPERQLYLRANWEFMTDYNFNVQANWVMQRERVFGDPREEIDDYVLVDMTLRKKNVVENLEVALIVKNLFDEDARAPSPNGVPVPLIPNDLPLPGRAVYGEIKYHF